MLCAVLFLIGKRNKYLISAGSFEDQYQAIIGNRMLYPRSIVEENSQMIHLHSQCKRASVHGIQG